MIDNKNKSRKLQMSFNKSRSKVMRFIIKAMENYESHLISRMPKNIIVPYGRTSNQCNNTFYTISTSFLI